MADFLDWGAVEYGDVGVGRYPVDEGGRRLFLIHDGQVDFPTTDFRRWLPLGTGASTVGRLNTNMMEFEVALRKTIASSDGQKFTVIVILSLKLKPDVDAWRTAAKDHAELETRIRTIVQNVTESVLPLYIYRDVYFSSPGALENFTDSMEEELRLRTPYELISCTFEAAARDASVDAAMQVAQREIAVETERARNERIEEERRVRQRLQELEQLHHETDIDRRRREAEELAEAARIRLKIALEEEAGISRAKVIKATLDGVTDPAILLAVTDPALYADIRKSEDLRKAETERTRLTKDYDSGVAAGLIKGVQGALGMQNLSPETLRIVHETSKEPEPDAE